MNPSKVITGHSNVLLELDFGDLTFQAVNFLGLFDVLPSRVPEKAAGAAPASEDFSFGSQQSRVCFSRRDGGYRRPTSKAHECWDEPGFPIAQTQLTLVVRSPRPGPSQRIYHERVGSPRRDTHRRVCGRLRSLTAVLGWPHHLGLVHVIRVPMAQLTVLSAPKAPNLAEIIQEESVLASARN